MRIYVFYIGKARDVHAGGLASEFIKRTARYCACEMREVHPERFDPWTRHPAAAKVLLDPSGRALTSSEFIQWIARAETEARDQVFVVGGAEGLPPEWKLRADLLLSLSPMTFPHELARAMLAEQIYRAFATLRGHPYPR